jgi:hypothetical protein
MLFLLRLFVSSKEQNRKPKIPCESSFKERTPMEKSREQIGTIGRAILGGYTGLLSLLLIYLVVTLWPTGPADAAGNVTIRMFGTSFSLSAEVRMICLVATVAGLGSTVHMATSFADFAGARRLYRSWVWWYMLRVFIGASLALVFYFVIRGGVLSVGTSASELNTYGVAAVAGLVGMFSKQATDKLRELFDNLFKTDKPEDRPDNLKGSS